MEKKCVALKWHQNVQKPFKLLRHMCIKILVFEFLNFNSVSFM